MDDVRSKVKPPTFHKPSFGVDGLKFQGFPIVTCSKLVVNVAKSPVVAAPRTKELFHFITSLAVARDFVLYTVTPPKLM